MRSLVIFISVLSIYLPQASVIACSTAYLPNSESKFMGKNFVWHYGEGRIVINRVNMEKVALARPDQTDKAMRWKSLYASITFNQIANDFPMGGMNTEGLGVEILLTGADFPQSSDKEIVSELQWIQYILDTSKNVQEAIANAKKVDIVPHSGFQVHYHVCDKHSSCAVFEYVGGELKVFDPESEGGLVPVGVNNVSYESMGSLDSSYGKNSFLSKKDTESTMDRCEKTREKVLSLEKQLSGIFQKDLLSMFKLMDTLNSQPQWQIVYALSKSKLAFRTQLGGSKWIYQLSFEDFLEEDLDCRKAIYSRKVEGRWKYFVKRPLAYDLEDFKPDLKLKRDDFFAPEISKSLVNKGIKFLDSSSVPRFMSEKLYKYPVTHTVCK